MTPRAGPGRLRGGGAGLQSDASWMRRKTTAGAARPASTSGAQVDLLRALESLRLESALARGGEELLGFLHAGSLRGGCGPDDVFHPGLQAHGVVEQTLCAHELQQAQPLGAVAPAAPAV